MIKPKVAVCEDKEKGLGVQHE